MSLWKYVSIRSHIYITKIENVIDGVDFKSKVTREELESISKDLFDRVIGPVKSVLKDAKLELKDISSMVLVGGGVRIPAVQKALIDFVGK